MSTRLLVRLHILVAALWNRLLIIGRRRRSDVVKRILVTHHLGRLTGTPTVTLFGPGSPTICGAGNYWRDSPFRAVTDGAFPCRDRQTMFGRHIHWLRRCGRPLNQSATPGACMSAVSLDSVRNAIDELLSARATDAMVAGVPAKIKKHGE